MGKKKRGHPEVEEILARPWCYYCERDFDDLKILINHQKAKHFKCERCGRRLNTAGGLSVHMTQVHKETLTTIENALPNRSNLDVEIFGMEGIPEEVVTSHNQRVVSQLTQAEADRRAATGNPSPGGAAGGPAKKPKFESPSDLKKRLAEHKAKKMVEQAAGISSGDVTPIDGGMGGQSPGYGQGDFVGSPGYPQPQMPYGGPSNGSTYASYPQSYGQQGMPFQQQPPNFPPQSSGFGPPLNQAFPGPNAFSPPQQYQQPGNPNFAPPQFQNGPLQAPLQHHQGPYQGGPPHPQFQNGPPQQPFQGGPSRAFGAGSPPVPFHQVGQFQPPRTLTPPQIGVLPQRSGSLPAAPGLPQRPSFGAPPVNAFQMQQMHQGQLPGPPNPTATAYQNSHNSQQNYGGSFDRSQNRTPPHPISASQSTNPTTQATTQISDSQAKSTNISEAVNDLVASAAADADKALAATGSQPEPKVEEQPGEKKAKKEKEKEKAVKMVYSDNEVSPEEKMAKLPRYAFVPDGKGETVLVDATTTAAVTGVVKGDESTMAN